MTSQSLTNRAELFRAAIQAHDIVRAGHALKEYVACFQSAPRTVQEVEQARDLFEWGVRLTRTQEARMSEELMLLKSVFDAYRPPRRFHTWRIEG
jgi:hypothetical protein